MRQSDHLINTINKYVQNILDEAKELPSLVTNSSTAKEPKEGTDHS
jgi:hypothetical protein